MNKKYIVICCITLALLATFFFDSFFFQGDDISYIAEPVARGAITQQVVATGEISPVQMVAVGARVTGQIERLHVQRGSTVTKGEMIAEIDSLTQHNELESAKAELATFKAKLASAEVAHRVAKAQYEREVSLGWADATSRENIENAENVFSTSKASLEEIRAQITRAQIAVNTAQLNFGYTKITAPFDGTVVSVHVEEGQTINASQSTPTIVKLADLSRVEIKIEISEADISKLAVGMPVSFTTLSDPKTAYPAVLGYLDPAPVDVTDNAVKETTPTAPQKAIYYYGRIITDNPDGQLRLGMTTKTVISIARTKDVLRVPNLAIHEEGEKLFVLVLGNRGPERRFITVGIADDMYTEVTQGLFLSERVVTAQMTEAEITASIDRLK